jgi:fucose permease
MSFMIGRIGIGLAANRLPLSRVLQLSIVMAGAGAILLSLNFGATTALIALVMLGAGLSSVLPLLVSTTADRVGTRHAVNGIGVQIALGSLGLSLVPAMIGRIGNAHGLEVVDVFLVVAAFLFWCLHNVVVPWAKSLESVSESVYHRV